MRYAFSDEIENPAYLAGKNYEEAPEEVCCDCVYWEEPPSGAWGVCAKHLESGVEWRCDDDEACEDFR